MSNLFPQQLQTNVVEENKPKLKKYEDLTSKEVETGINNVLKSSTYTGSSRNSLIQALHDCLSGKMTVSYAAALYQIPFSTLHPKMKQFKMNLGVYEPNATRPRMSNKRYHDRTEAEAESVKPKKHRNRKSRYVKQTVFSNYLLEIPENIKALVWEIVSKCSYDDNERKQRLYKGVLDVLIHKKTLKTAASDNNIPFTTLQTYFHRSKIILKQQMDVDRVQKDEPLCETTQSSSSEEQPPILEYYPKQSESNFGTLDQTSDILATLPPEQQSYLAQWMYNFNAVQQLAAAPSTNVSFQNIITLIMYWIIADNISRTMINALFEIPKPSNSYGINLSPSSTTLSQSDNSIILEQLAAMQPINLKASVNFSNDQPNITISERCSEE